MSDDRWNSDDERAPFLDRTPRPGVRPAATQPDRRGPPTPEEIAAFVATEFGGEKTAAKKKLLRPPGWDGAEPKEPERGDAYEAPETTSEGKA